MKCRQEIDFIRLKPGKNRSHGCRLPEVNGCDIPRPGVYHLVPAESEHLNLFFGHQAGKICPVLSVATDDEGLTQRYTNSTAGRGNKSLPPEARKFASFSMIPSRKCQGRTTNTSGRIARASFSEMMGI